MKLLSEGFCPLKNFLIFPSVFFYYKNSFYRTINTENLFSLKKHFYSFIFHFKCNFCEQSTVRWAPWVLPRLWVCFHELNYYMTLNIWSTMQLQTKLFHTNVDDALLDMSAAEKGRKRSINNFIIIKHSMSYVLSLWECMMKINFILAIIKSQFSYFCVLSIHLFYFPLNAIENKENILLWIIRSSLERNKNFKLYVN